MIKSGCLYIIATPIGHLQDISYRAVETLKQLDFIAVEDTRHSKILLQHYAITTPVMAFYQQNERNKTHYLLQQLKQGKSIGLISDAGTPLISDPGYYLVKQAHQQGIQVIPIPGASALITALSVAGLATDKFMFEGFLPRKTEARLKYLKTLVYQQRTLVFYESCHRIIATIDDMQQIFGQQRQAVILRELTKTFETIYANSLENILLWLQQDTNQQKGEFVIVVAGNAIAPDLSLVSVEQLLPMLLQHLSVKQTVQISQQLFDLPKKQLYQQAVKLKSE